MSPPGPAEGKVKHLEMIQTVISRLGNDSFVIKGWAVTVNGVFLGFAVSAKQPGLAAVAIAPAFLFWLLDTYYLRSERLFRLLYDRVRTTDEVGPFDMSATGPDFIATLEGDAAHTAGYWRTMVRPTLRWLYGGLIVVAIAVAAILAASSSSPSEASEGCSKLIRQPAESRSWCR